MRSGGPGRLRWNWEGRERIRRNRGTEKGERGWEDGEKGKGRRRERKLREKYENTQLVGNGDKYSHKPHLLGTVWLA